MKDAGGPNGFEPVLLWFEDLVREMVNPELTALKR
jgi:hypothetical protein